MLKLKTVPWTYVISCHDGEEIVGRFYENEMWKTNHIQTIINQIKLYVKWKGYNNSFNNWIDKKRLFSETETFGEICENWVRFF